MIKFKLTFDKDAEQEWLNSQCQEGWAFAGFCLGLFTFIPCRKGEYIYQIDLLPGQGFRPSDPEGYSEFMSEAGVEVIQRWFRWVYLRKRAEDGPFEVYTDAQSKAAMYRRIRAMFLWAFALELSCSVSIINLLVRFNTVFTRVLVAIWLIVISSMLRAVYRCTKIIRDLEQT